MTQETTPITDDFVRIESIENQPVLRNLLITQAYHEYAVCLGKALGNENANWCNFATWASRTAGTFIRDEEVPALLRNKIENSSAYKDARSNLANHATDADHDEYSVRLYKLIPSIIGNVSENIVLGNLKVYAELAPFFSLMIREFSGNPGK